jgi:hypothetical protein
MARAVTPPGATSPGPARRRRDRRRRDPLRGWRRHTGRRARRRGGDCAFLVRKRPPPAGSSSPRGPGRLRKFDHVPVEGLMPLPLAPRTGHPRHQHIPSCPAAAGVLHL